MIQDATPGPPRDTKSAAATNPQNWVAEANTSDPTETMRLATMAPTRGPKLSSTMPNRNGENMDKPDAQLNIRAVSSRFKPAPPSSVDAPNKV
mmetsp:Transcript_35552/g.86160  ORF Transcript_35552/g.86160 Transcript_35552/m.86160 type:complete len:93 (+) Transcript_35552:412-690(+)